jgi:arylsulfatase A-like enzyme
MGWSPTRRTFGKLTAAAGIATLAGVRNSTAARARPNVLLIICDQEQSWLDIPASIDLPNRRRIEERAVHFTNAHVVNPLCSTSRGNIYSGQHGQYTGLWENTPVPWSPGGLVEGVPTIGHMMKAAGYTTIYNGKWHLTDIPVGPTQSGGLTPDETRTLFQSAGFDISDQEGEMDGPHGGYIHDPKTATRAARFICDRIGEDAPWFQAVNFVNPHDIMFFRANAHQEESRAFHKTFLSMVAPDDPIYAHDNEIDLPANFGDDFRKAGITAHEQHAHMYERVFGDIPWEDEALWRHYRNYYYNCLRDVDRHIGTVLDALEASGQADNTIVVFTADHGEMAGAHGHRGKGSLIYKEAARVPLLVIHPGVEGGVTTEALTSHVDLVPTILSLSGVGRAQLADEYRALKGQDFSSVLEAPQGLGPRADSGVLFQWSSLAYLDGDFSAAAGRTMEAEGFFAKLGSMWEGPNLPDFDNRGFMRGVYDGRHKFGRYFAPTDHHQPADFDALVGSNDLELYDTKADPLEQNNLAADHSSSRELLVAMNAKLNALSDYEVGIDDGSYMPGPGFLWTL